MALTLTEPHFLLPTYADHIYNLHDVPRQAATDLYYELDITVGSVTRTLRQLPDVNKQANINIAKILQSFFTSDIYLHDYTAVYQLRYFACLAYTVVARSISAGSTETTNGTEHWVFNGTLQYDQTWTYYDYFTTTGQTSKFLNNWTSYKRVHRDDDIFLETFTGDFLTGGITFTPVFAGLHADIHYNSGSTYSFDMAHTQDTTPAILNMNVGLKALNVWDPSALIDNVNYYEISEINGYIEPVRIYVTETDSRYNRYFRIAFIGPLGSPELFNFDLDARNTFNVEKTEFKNANLSKIYNINVDQTYRVTSNYITEDEAFDLRYLWTSPIVFNYEADSTYLTDIPIIVEDKSVDVLNRRNQKLINYNMTFRYAYEYVNYRQ